MLPWWVVLLLSVYVLLKLGLFFEGACGTLGIHAPVSRGTVSKAFRTLSTCTHPDKLINHSPWDKVRGELLFKRASAAKERLLAALRADEGEDPTFVSCDTQLDAAIYQGFLLVGAWLMETGATSILSSVFTFLFELVTFNYDLSTTISCVLLSLTALRTLQSLLYYLFATGPITTLLSIVTYSLIGPLPSFYRFLVLPPMRFYCFVKNDLLPFARGKEQKKLCAPTPSSSKAGDSLSTPAPSTNTTAEAANNTDDGEGADGHASEDEDTAPLPPMFRAAGAKSAKEEPPLTNSSTSASATSSHSGASPLRDKAPVRGVRETKGAKQPDGLAAEAAPAAHASPFGPPVGTLSLRRVIERKPLPDMRVAAAAHVQFELLLSTTKYVIPLATLVATGQAFNGLWSSMITAQVLNKIPPMRPESQHVLLLVVGALHTLLCASKSQLNEAPAGVLQLQWTWSANDVLAVANIMMLGAIAASAAHSGNEPTFCASFAAGLTLRMVAAEALPSAVTAELVRLLRRFDLEVIGVDEVSVRAGRGVGSCGGGALRSMLGAYDTSPLTLSLSSLVVKVFLLMMPALAALQWGLRSAILVRRLRRESQRQGRPKPLRSGEMLVPVLRRRLLASLVMTAAMSLMIFYFCAYELSGINGSLGNFLVAALIGCLFESLLATYELQGRLRQFTFFILFMFL